MGEADYFGIERLKLWLKSQEYEKAVKVEHSVEDIEGLDRMAKTYQINVQLEYHPTWRTRKVYVCPRDIGIHRGNPSACGKACERARGDTEDKFEDEDELRTIVITRRLILDYSICLK